MKIYTEHVNFRLYLSTLYKWIHITNLKDSLIDISVDWLIGRLIDKYTKGYVIVYIHIGD